MEEGQKDSIVILSIMIDSISALFSLESTVKSVHQASLYFYYRPNSGNINKNAFRILVKVNTEFEDALLKTKFFIRGKFLRFSKCEKDQELLPIYFLKPNEIRALISRIYFKCKGGDLSSLNKIQNFLDKKFGKTLQTGIDSELSVYFVVFRAKKARHSFEEFTRNNQCHEGCEFTQVSQISAWDELIANTGSGSSASKNLKHRGSKRNPSNKFQDNSKAVLLNESNESFIHATRKIGHSNLKKSSKQHQSAKLDIRRQLRIVSAKIPYYSSYLWSYRVIYYKGIGLTV